jgi:intein/homing endonuclease
MPVDFVMIDYLDLVMPVSVKVNPNDQFIKDKYVSEELRNLAKELSVLMVTASQLNRCLTLDTKVEVNGTETEIRNIVVGDWIHSNEGPVKVIEKLPVVKQKVYRIKTKSGKEIRCSENHMFPVDGKLKTIHSGLKVGDKLKVVINNNSVSGE